MWPQLQRLCRRFVSLKFGVRENFCFCLFPVILHTLLFKWFPVNILYTLEFFKTSGKNLVSHKFESLAAGCRPCFSHCSRLDSPLWSCLMKTCSIQIFWSFAPTDGWRSADCTEEGDEQLSRRHKLAKVQHLHSAMFPLCGGEPHVASLWELFSTLTDCHLFKTG